MEIPQIFEKVCLKNGWTYHQGEAEIALGGGRRQKVRVETFDHQGEAMARAYSIVGESDVLSDSRVRSALSLNFNLPHGALAIREDQLVLTDTFLVKDADESEVEASIRFIAETADRYEATIYGTDHH